MSSMLECFHCEDTGHWATECPLLQMPDDKRDHEQRITEITRRFGYEEIGPTAKTRMIKKENELWKARQKEMAK